MPQFQYQGVDKAGKKVTGNLESPNEGDLRLVLRGMGIRPVRIQKVSTLNFDLGKLFSGTGGPVKLVSLINFTRQLQILISSGIPLVQALEILLEQTTDPQMRTLLIAIREKVSAGSFLWEAISQYPKAFPKLYIALIRAGEAAGAMDGVLKRLTGYLEESDRIRRLLKSAMMYPVIVTLIGIGVVSMMLIFVIPKFEAMLTAGGQELPGPTQFVIDFSHFMVKYGLYLAIGSGVLGYLLKQYIVSPEGKSILDRALFKAPLAGPLMQKAGVARFSRTLQTLLASGINLIDAIDICRTTIDNAVLEVAVKGLRAEVEAGKSFGAVMTTMTVFPRMAVQMISVGESTGNLDLMLEKVAVYYEAEVESLVNGLTKLIEPITLVVLGGTVGGILIAMYLPIFKMAGGV